MKTLIVLFAVAVYTSEAALKCVQGTDGTAAATDCETAGETKCSQPKFVQYTGLSTGVQYKCGACADAATENKTCDSCTGEACNKPKATGADFECRNWVFKAVSETDKTEKWQLDTTNSTCKRLKDTKIECNKPGAKAVKATPVSVCGPCTAEAKKGELCADCNTDKCNSAGSIFAVFVPLVVALYILM